MKISVITVCWNSEKTIGYTIESFLKQTYENKELLVIDGASKDRTIQIARDFGSAAIKVHSEPDKGIYDAMNKGLSLYSGDAVGMLNSDDCFHDADVLADIATSLMNHDATYGNLDFVENHMSKRVVRRWRNGPLPNSGFNLGWAPAHPTFYVRRELAERVGKYDQSYRIAADYDWMVRAINVCGAKTKFIDRVLIDMMIGGLSTGGVSSVYTNAIECLKVRQKWINSGPMDIAFFAKPLRQLYQLATK